MTVGDMPDNDLELVAKRYHVEFDVEYDKGYRRCALEVAQFDSHDEADTFAREYMGSTTQLVESVARAMDKRIDKGERQAGDESRPIIGAWVETWDGSGILGATAVIPD